MQESQDWSELEEAALEGCKVVGKLKEDVRDKVKEELTVLQMEALYKQVRENFIQLEWCSYLYPGHSREIISGGGVGNGYKI